MALAGIVPLLAEARDRRYAVLAFNVILLEYAEAIVAAAEAAGAGADPETAGVGAICACAGASRSARRTA